jgi:capsid assembly protease
LRFQLRSVLADTDVRALILDINSPGGMVAGTFETAVLIRAVAAKKRTIAVIDDMAASAGYALASAASKIIITPSGVAGSIGCVCLHWDHSARLEKAGIVPSLIFAGRKKVNGNPYQALPDGVRQDLQDEVDAALTMFVDAVAQSRPNLTPAAIRAMEAACYVGQAAIDVGLADEIGDMETALAELAALKAPGPSADVPPAGLIGTATSSGASPPAKTAADPSRIAAFLALPEAVGREDYARIMAMQGTSIEIAKAALATMPTMAERAARGSSAPKPVPASPAKTTAETWDEIISGMNERAKRPF